MADAGREVAETTVALPPGQVATALMLPLALRGRAPVAPRLDLDGIHLPLPRRRLGGEGDLLITPEGTGSRIVLRGQPPPWPLALGWAARTLRGLVRAATRFPSSAG